MSTNRPSPETAHDRILGAMFGVALGDAMGMPSELWSRGRVIKHFGRIEGFLPAPKGHFIVDGFVAGQVTDDTQQMIMLAESITHAGGRVDTETLAVDLVAWADRVGASDGKFLGPTSARVIDRLRDGVPAADTGVAGTTNGAAMRIAPVGVLCPSSDIPALVAEVEASCKLAHHTNIAVAGAAMVAAFISSAIDAPADQSRQATLHAALRASYGAGELGMSLGRDEPGASLIRRTMLAVDVANTAETDDEFLEFVYDIIGANTETTESVPASIALVIRAKGDPVTAVLLAANLGGDSDTIGAIAGGMCGAVAGYNAIPQHMINQLSEVNDLPIGPLAEQLISFRRQRERAELTV
ncbi:ADP-ribosylglycohydrolase family protein [Arthrobacter sp. Soil762]|uniref:ADP-ribosylglycohydrolase family protein n=1 Tax=Arthrobacter sp. Soil762 TaxID=1736401 RepID=UPI00138EF6EA|nr:ADP-ribosylglycohydrolase family protein [Arthrobacter sp. Soil762]